MRDDTGGFDSQDDGTKACTSTGSLGHQSRQTGSQQEDSHDGEGDKSQSSATLGVDQKQGGNGEDDLNGTVTQRCEQSLVGVLEHIVEDR